jgi:alkanesulfonate monooxygenase SsuD/methylene tetrahydromethanopterin reductase-like flavin-dependent oxidoreductase (luciferase family)
VLPEFLLRKFVRAKNDGDSSETAVTPPNMMARFVDFPTMQTWPKPVQKPSPPIIVGGAFPYAARRAIQYGDGWVPIAGRAPYGDVNEYLPKFKQMVAEAGRFPDALSITLFSGTEDADL